MMRKKLFLGIIPVALFAVIAGGCTQSGAVGGNNSQAANSPTAVNADKGGGQTIAATGEITRTELTENARFAAELKTEPGAVEAGSDATLVFTVKDRQGAVAKDLKIVHEKPMHLLVVSDDLAFFDHVHPEQQPDGTFRQTYKFPNGGRFKLYADFTPESSPQIVNVFDVGVGGSPRERTPLAADQELKKTVDGLTVTVKTAQPIKAASGQMFDFFVNDAEGKPVTDLQPYLGAMAHFVVISEDATKFLHVHAIEGETTETKGTGGHSDHKDSHGEMEMDVKPGTDKTAKPTVQAHTEFPTAGLYKLWAQFQRGGKVFTVPFVFNVEEGAKKTAQNAEIPPDATRVTVSSAGFEPASIAARKGETVKLAFTRKDANNCASEVVFPKLKVKKRLPVGETVLVEVKAPESGEISFACGMNMYQGKVVVQ
jgi:hypothetical protein